MVSSVKKGYNSEYKAKQYLISLGFNVDTIVKTRFKKDLFNVADLIAIKYGVMYPVQVKSNKNKVESKYKKWVIENECPLIYISVNDGVSPTGYIVTPNASEVEYTDLRCMIND